MKPLLPLNLVWIKRDLRTQDHAPLEAAEKDGKPYCIIFLWEPALLNAPDQSDRHRCFEWQSLQDMNQTLAPFHRKVELLYADAVDVMEWFSQNYALHKVFSYQESGTAITYQRDLNVQKLMLRHGVEWQEFQRNGVRRGLKTREGWDRSWYDHASSRCIDNHFQTSVLDRPSFPKSWEVPPLLLAKYVQYVPAMQAGGEKNAWRYWSSFAIERHTNYHRLISKPLESRKSCSRLSPYLSWGNLSIRQVWNATRTMQECNSKANINLKAMQAFRDRLRWHDHFIQKFEQDYLYESRAINRAFRQLPTSNSEDLLVAWAQGQTGYPLVDACMRALEATGWVNFRMRALLVSFLTHTLNLDWTHGTHHLAKLFLDYHPGIHYTQFQMQAGVTGANLIRAYNPVLNGLRHDSNGEFVRQWIPELAPLPDKLLQQPWLITEIEAKMYVYQAGITYPNPVVHPNAKRKPMVEHLWKTRQTEEALHEKGRILNKFARLPIKR